MKLLRLKTDGFGGLRGEHRFDGDRLTLVVDDNERGKSTLLAAIVAALYGLSDDKRTHRPITPLDRWRPWDGGPFNVELELECGGEHYTIQRDFTSNTVAVWNDRAQELTAQFLEGRDEYPVGKHLLGLDAEEFEKCAFVSQEELDQVVPADEKDRRANTLQARLERAADTRAGNSSANEALRVLEESAARYTEPLLDTTLKIENAIQRLDTKVATLESELHALEHDDVAIQPQLERLAVLEEQERMELTHDRQLKAEFRAAFEAESRARLERHHQSVTRLVQLEHESAELAPFENVPAAADGEFRQAVTLIEEAGRQRQQLEDDHELFEGGLRHLDSELGKLARFAALSEADADRFIGYAAELRRLQGEDVRLTTLLDGARRELALQGFDDETIAVLEQRFATLDAASRELLDGQPALGFELQARSVDADQSRLRSATVLGEITAGRRGRGIPAVVLLVLGLVAGGLAAGQYLRDWFVVPWEAFAAGALVLGLVATLLFVLAARYRAAEWQDSRRAAEVADEMLATVGARRESNERQLGELAHHVAAPDTGELLRSWGEWGRLGREREPSERVAAERAAIYAARNTVNHQAGNPPDASFLEEASKAIRSRTLIAQQREQLAERLSTTDAQLANMRTRIADLEAQAHVVLAHTGLEHDPARTWAAHTDEVGRRARAAQRVAALDREIIPQTRRNVLEDAYVKHLEQTLAMLDAEAGPAAPDAEPARDPSLPVRNVAEIERDRHGIQTRLEALRRERGELRLRVDDVSRRFHKEHPDKLIERDAFARATVRARRFKAATDLARTTIQQVALETHKRWAEFLNLRVGQLVGSVGTGVDDVRFGEDLDFAVKPRNGQQVSRGKAVRQLSSGARDQLHLAVRLAISEYLSRDEALPILIDDCFATSDDGRARAGMKLLIEQFSQQHQVVVVTCHRGRFEALAAADGELYSRRVHWIDTRSMRSGTEAAARQG